MSDLSSSLWSGAMPNTQRGTPAQTGQLDNTPLSTFNGLSIGSLNSINPVQSRFETPQPANAASISPFMPSGGDLLTLDATNAFGYGQDRLLSTPTAQPPLTPNMHAFALQPVPSRQRSFVQQPSLAQRANNAPSPNTLHSPYPLGSPNIRLGMGRTMQSPTTPNVPPQPYYSYSSPHMYDQPLHSPTWSTTPTMTPQSALFPGVYGLPQQQKRIPGVGPLSPPQYVLTQAEIDVEWQRQLHQQQIRMQHRMQQQRMTPEQRHYATQLPQQVSVQQSQGQSMVHLPVNIQQGQRFLDPATVQPHPQMQIYSPVRTPALANLTLMPNDKKRAAPFQDDRSSKRVRVVDPRDLDIRKDLRSPHLQHNVLAPSNGSNLPPVHQNINLGKQHTLRQITPGPAKFGTSMQQQQEHQTQQSGNANDMSRNRQDSGLVEPQPPLKKSRLPAVQYESQTPSRSILPQASHALGDDVQHLSAPAQAQTPTKPQSIVQLQPTSPPTYPQHGKTPAQPHTPVTLHLEPWNSLFSPPRYPQQSKPELPPDDIFASMLQSVIGNAKGTNTDTKQQEDSALLAAPYEVLIAGPLTKEQNSKALVEAVKEDMKRRGPSVGTNPDLDTAAKPHFILGQRREWTEEVMRESGYSKRGCGYVLANKVMESAVGYSPGR